MKTDKLKLVHNSLVFSATLFSLSIKIPFTIEKAIKTKSIKIVVGFP
jgi:hypothetical protein